MEENCLNYLIRFSLVTSASASLSRDRSYSTAWMNVSGVPSLESTKITSFGSRRGVSTDRKITGPSKRFGMACTVPRLKKSNWPGRNSIKSVTHQGPRLLARIFSLSLPAHSSPSIRNLSSTACAYRFRSGLCGELASQAARSRKYICIAFKSCRDISVDNSIALP